MGVITLTTGEKITVTNGVMNVPNNPIIPFIEGDGIGPDIWAAASRVIDAAVEKAYDGEKKIVWKEVLAGEKAFNQTGEWLPEETLDVIREYLIAIKGPLTTPIGGGIRSLNVALRQEFDLYVCLRPVRYFEGVPSPVKRPEDTDMVIFRENTEDIYAGIEYAEGSDRSRKSSLTSFKMKWVLIKSVSQKLLVLVLNQFQRKVQNVLFALQFNMQLKKDVILLH